MSACVPRACVAAQSDTVNTERSAWGARGALDVRDSSESARWTTSSSGRIEVNVR